MEETMNRLLNHEEVEAMRRATGSPRKAAIVALAWDAAPTYRELLSMRVEDAKGLTGRDPQLELTTLSNDQTLVPLSSSTEPLLHYLSRTHPSPGEKEAPLFPDLTGYEINWTLDRLSSEAGIEREVDLDLIRTSRLAVLTTFSDPSEVCSRFRP